MTECVDCKGRRLVVVTPASPPYGETYAPCRACAPVRLGQPPEEAARSNNPKGYDLRARASHWIHTHMDASLELLHYAQDLAAARRGLPKRQRIFGIGMIYEHFRYEAMKRLGKDWKQGEYLLNNNFRAYVARWMIEQDPELEKFLVFRKTQW